MHSQYTFRPYPTSDLQIALIEVFGRARLVFNEALAVWRDACSAGETVTAASGFSKRMITEKAPKISVGLALGRFGMTSIGTCEAQDGRNWDNVRRVATVDGASQDASKCFVELRASRQC